GADRVQEMTHLVSPLASVLADIDEPIDEIRAAEIAAAVADSLVSLSNRANHRTSTTNLRAVELVRDFLTAHAREQTPASVLENIAGADRFTIARHFSCDFGTSPYRYRPLRLLEPARTSIASGEP